MASFFLYLFLNFSLSREENKPGKLEVDERAKTSPKTHESSIPREYAADYRRVPHSRQKLASAGIPAPHLGQSRPPATLAVEESCPVLSQFFNWVRRLPSAFDLRPQRLQTIVYRLRRVQQGTKKHVNFPVTTFAV